MTLDNLKRKLYERFASYWGGATIAWGKTGKVKPNAPLVVLRTGTVTRSTQPITQMVNGIVFSAYPSEVPVQVDLFTRGRLVSLDDGDGEYSENSAENDLLDFVNFLDSTASVEWSSQHDISISLLNGVQDVSEVINDSQWQYRAMTELSVSFTQWTAEYHGILNESSIIFDENGIPRGVVQENWTPTASGGGTQALADEKTGSFEELTTPEYKEVNN